MITVLILLLVLFILQYDMRSQIYYQCIGAANSPLALVKQGLEEFIFGFGIAPDKLVLGVPWYGYKYACADSNGSLADARFCSLSPVRFTIQYFATYTIYHIQSMRPVIHVLYCIYVCVYIY